MTLLKWALIFLVISLIAALFGFGGIAAASADIARILFYIFIVIFLVLNLRFTFNPIYAEVPTKQAVMYYLLALGLVSFVRSPKQVVPIIRSLMLGQFVVGSLWNIYGIVRGLPTYQFWQ